MASAPPRIVTIWSTPSGASTLATGRCGCSRTRRPSRSFSVLAASTSARIDAESANRNPDTSIVSCRVLPASCPVSSSPNYSAQVRSASTVTGPDSPATTDASSMPQATPLTSLSRAGRADACGCAAQREATDAPERSRRQALRAKAWSRLPKQGMRRLRLVMTADGSVLLVFAITGLHQIIPLFDSLDEALALRPAAVIRPLRPRPCAGRALLDSPGGGA